jgi:hypothetical protein
MCSPELKVLFKVLNYDVEQKIWSQFDLWIQNKLYLTHKTK